MRSMRATGLSAAILVLAATLARADSNTEALDLIASMTASLSDDDAAGFLREFERAMPGYDHLDRAIPALLGQGGITCSVQPLSNDGDDAKRALTLDWYLEIRPVDPAAPVVRRRDVIQMRIEKREKHWRVVALDPLSFFDPQDFTHR